MVKLRFGSDKYEVILITYDKDTIYKKWTDFKILYRINDGEVITHEFNTQLSNMDISKLTMDDLFYMLHWEMNFLPNTNLLPLDIQVFIHYRMNQLYSKLMNKTHSEYNTLEYIVGKFAIERRGLNETEIEIIENIVNIFNSL